MASSDLSETVLRPRAEVTLVPTEHGGVLVDPTRGRLHAVNAQARAIWEVLEGGVRLGELADDVAAVSGMALDEAREQVTALARTFERAGVIDGLGEPPVPMADDHDHHDDHDDHDHDQPARMPRAATHHDLGTPLGDHEFADGDGDLAPLASAVDRPTVLVNWSPTCGFCLEIAGLLEQMDGPLDDVGYDLLLWANGEPKYNAEVLGDDSVLSVVHQPEDRGHPFDGIGTPAAYVLDEDAVVIEELAIGALTVPALLRRITGLPDPFDEPVVDGRFMVRERSAACAPGARSARTWSATRGLPLDSVVVGVRADDQATMELLDDVFDGWIDDLPGLPSNVSVVLPGGTSGDGRRRELNLVLRGTEEVVRTRSPRRAVDALALWLSGMDATAPSDDHVGTRQAVAIVDGRAILLPVTRSNMRRLQPRLARSGVALHDGPVAWVDLARAEVVLPGPTVAVDRSALEGVPSVEAKSEPPAATPGTYPIAGWILEVLGGEEGPADAAVAAAAAAAHLGIVEDLPATTRALVDAFAGDVPAWIVHSSGADEVRTALDRLRAVTGDR